MPVAIKWKDIYKFSWSWFNGYNMICVKANIIIMRPVQNICADNVVVADGLAPIWCQDISNRHENIDQSVSR